MVDMVAMPINDGDTPPRTPPAELGLFDLESDSESETDSIFDDDATEEGDPSGSDDDDGGIVLSLPEYINNCFGQ
jgi:hypothetical protein